MEEKEPIYRHKVASRYDRRLGTRKPQTPWRCDLASELRNSEESRKAGDYRRGLIRFGRQLPVQIWDSCPTSRICGGTSSAFLRPIGAAVPREHPGSWVVGD